MKMVVLMMGMAGRRPFGAYWTTPACRDGRFRKSLAAKRVLGRY